MSAFFSLGSFSPSDNWLELGLCGGELNVFIRELNTIQSISAINNVNYNDNSWHHLAVTKTATTLTFYIDCQVVGTPISLNTGFNFSNFHVGRQFTGAASPGMFWQGQQDDVRLWDFAKTQIQIDDEKHCVLSGQEKGLILYWNFDEGMAGGNNAGAVAVDSSPNGYDGTFNNFALLNNNSNYISSTAPLVYPNLNNLDLEIRDYPYRTNLLTEICPEEPAHFCLLKDGSTPGPYSNVLVDWFYDDGVGEVALTSPPFSGFKYGVPAGEIKYDCSASTNGYVDRTYYAKSTVTEPSTGEVCVYKSEEYDLRICCPISSSTVSMTPSTPMCEFGTTQFTVCLNSPDPFVQTPGSFVDIEWYLDGNYLGFTDQTCINYTLSGIGGITTPLPFCFEARVSNCNGKTASFQACNTIDPDPVCGTIEALPQGSPMNLTLVATSPHLIYELCPEDDAQLGIIQPFQKCNPQWQYTFTPSTPNSWQSLGFTNSVQNTNILPTPAWTGNSIFYRIECQTLSNPSGCDPCYSDMIEIRLATPPPANSITGNNQLCAGQSNTLSVANPNAAHTYTWYCDGLQVGTGTTYMYSAAQSACYWIESSDGCYVVESPPYCVTVCQVIPSLTCPLPPNDCACLGDPITLSACNSSSTCSPANLQFTWYIDNVLQNNPGCTITHTPPAAGATYRVEIVDTVTGCTAFREKTIIPCDKQ
ncbi:MAG: LamG-like jellyroll fold domain-containing protein [Saprospiraceae bacterium]